MDEHLYVRPGETLKQNQRLGKVGPKFLSNGMLNGWTTGPHLHLSLYNEKGDTVDPATFSFQMPEKRE